LARHPQAEIALTHRRGATGGWLAALAAEELNPLDRLTGHRLAMLVACAPMTNAGRMEYLRSTGPCKNNFYPNSFVAICVTCCPWNRAMSSSWALGMRSPFPPAIVEAP
jgi:hypothetical protein